MLASGGLGDAIDWAVLMMLCSVCFGLALTALGVAVLKWPRSKAVTAMFGFLPFAITAVAMATLHHWLALCEYSLFFYHIWNVALLSVTVSGGLAVLALLVFPRRPKVIIALATLLPAYMYFWASGLPYSMYPEAAVLAVAGALVAALGLLLQLRPRSRPWVAGVLFFLGFVGVLGLTCCVLPGLFP